MKNRTGLRLIAAALAALLLCGCGKKEPEPTTEPETEPPVEMIFMDVTEAVTAKDSTNLRTAPSQGEDSEVIYTLQNGEVINRIGISDSGWSKLNFEGKTCYAVSSFLTSDLTYKPSEHEEDDGIQTTFAPADYTVTAKETVNLRSIPSVTNPEVEIVGQLNNGETVQCTGFSDNGWSRVEFDGQVCYAVSNYLTTDLNYQPPKQPAYMEEDGINTVFTEADGNVTAKDTVNLRSLPSVTNPEAAVMAQLHKGEVAQRLGVSESGWTKLNFNGKTYYAVSSYLTTNLDGTPDDREPDPDGDGIRTQFTDVHEKVTAKDAVNLRAKPSTTDPDAVVVKKLKNGEIVIRTGINEDVGWSRVEYQGQTLYCVSNYLMLSPLQ